MVIAAFASTLFLIAKVAKHWGSSGYGIATEWITRLGDMMMARYSM